LPSDPEWQRAVEIAERYADGLETLAALRAVRLRDYREEPNYYALWSIWPAVASALRPMADAVGAARAVAVAAHNHANREATDDRAGSRRGARERSAQAELLRDILGNSFRPVPVVDPAWLGWEGGAAEQVARAAYEDRCLPEGTLDPDRLALLADALEDAGCTDAELLGHLRGPGPHVRGCWALDLVLSKE
jgi:hypothetical protein